MKRYMNLALLYAILAMTGDVFYWEFTKFSSFTAKTTLSVVHTHYFLLGMVFFLLLVVLEKNLSFTGAKPGRVLLTYHIGLNLTSVMLVVRGVTQVKGGRALQGRGRRHLRYSRNRTYPAGRQLGTSAAVDQAQRVGVPVLTRTIKRGRYRPFIHFSSYPYLTISWISS